MSLEEIAEKLNAEKTNALRTDAAVHLFVP
jgi:hypothetical protein